MAEEKLSYENIDCEFKELYVSDIKKTVVAFANTEGGVLYMVKAHNVHMEGKKVLIIGNGGACAAVKAVCEHEKAKDIVIVSRSANRGAISYDEMYTSHLDADIVVNTSPVGMLR